MDLHRLQHVIALAETGHFGRAALRAHISQSALSRSIQAAEREFGFALFDRNGASVTPTTAGKFIIERAHKLLFDSRCLMRDADLYRERRIGELAFGTGPYSGAVFLRTLLITLRQHFPQVQARAVMGGSDPLLAQLKAEEIDFFMGDMRTIRSDADLVVTPLVQMEAAFFARPGHPLLGEAVITPAMLLTHGIASVRAPRDVKVALGKAMGLQNDAPVPQVIELDDLGALRDIAMQTDTVIGCAVAATHDDVAARRLVRLNVPAMPSIHAMIGIVVLRGRTLSPMAQWACDHLQQRARHMQPGIAA